MRKVRLNELKEFAQEAQLIKRQNQHENPALTAKPMLSFTTLYSFPGVRQKIGKKLNRQRPYERHQWRWGGGSYYPVSLWERAAAVGGFLKSSHLRVRPRWGKGYCWDEVRSPFPLPDIGDGIREQTNHICKLCRWSSTQGHCLMLWKDLAIKDVVICPNRRVMNRQTVRNRVQVCPCVYSSVHSASTYSIWYCGHKASGGGEGPEGDAAWGRSKHQTSKRNDYCRFNNANDIRDSN